MSRAFSFVTDLAGALVVGLLVSYVVAWCSFWTIAVWDFQGWYLRAATGFVAALVFVHAGSLSMGSTDAASSLLRFMFGAGLAWLAVRWLGEWGSPYRGVAELVITFLGGGVGVLLSQRLKPGSSPTPKVATASVFVIVSFATFAYAFQRPAYGYPGLVFRPSGEYAAVRFLWVEEYTKAIVWSSATDASWATEAVLRGALDLETDPGSGPSAGRVIPLDTEGISRYERLAQGEMVERIESEWRGQTIPLILVDLPYRSLHLEAGSTVLVEW
jgi:hypothetical protein